MNKIVINRSNIDDLFEKVKKLLYNERNKNK